MASQHWLAVFLFEIEETNLDCYWVGSLDFSFFGKLRGFPLNPQKVQLFAEGSAATAGGVLCGSSAALS